MSVKLEVRDTLRYGRGFFACEEIRRGETIFVFTGEIVSADEIMRRIVTGEERIDDPLQIDEWLFLDINDLSINFNHSCEPNAGMRGRSELFALRDILPGEEITYDYSSVVGPNISADMWTMECTCGAKSCRKTVGNVLTIPEDRLSAYIEDGALQDYMKKALNIQEKGVDGSKRVKK